jgi:hypothetical protein
MPKRAGANLLRWCGGHSSQQDAVLAGMQNRQELFAHEDGDGCRSRNMQLLFAHEEMGDTNEKGGGKACGRVVAVPADGDGCSLPQLWIEWPEQGILF